MPRVRERSSQFLLVSIHEDKTNLSQNVLPWRAGRDIWCQCCLNSERRGIGFALGKRGAKLATTSS